MQNREESHSISEILDEISLADYEKFVEAGQREKGLFLIKDILTEALDQAEITVKREPTPVNLVTAMALREMLEQAGQCQERGAK